MHMRYMRPKQLHGLPAIEVIYQGAVFKAKLRVWHMPWLPACRLPP